MTTKYYIKLDQYIKTMTPKQLAKIFPKGTNKSTLMRSIIMNEKTHGQNPSGRTLRGVWYSVVKPTLDKLGLLSDADQTEVGLQNWDKTLSRYMTDLLKRGYLMYSDLGIRDISRQKQAPNVSHYSTGNGTYSYQGTVAPYPNIIIATEKDTVYSLIQQMAQLFGCSCISSKGQNAIGAMELLIKQIMYSGKNFDTIHILSLTDYDPAGYYIAGALKAQAVSILNALGHDHIDVVAERIGIEPDQLDAQTVRDNMYTPKETNLDKWLIATGGIDGLKKGLELDALSKTQLRQIFVDSIKPYITDLDHYEHFVKKAFLKQEFLDLMADKFEQASTEFIDDNIYNMELEQIDIFDLAINGYSTIPINHYCTIDDEFLKEGLNKAIETISGVDEND